MGRIIELIILGILLILGLVIGQQLTDNPNTELVVEQDDTLVLFSTLRGSLVGVSQRTGEIRWQQDNEPVVKAPIDLPDTKMQMFLPDPRDGTLYLFCKDSEALKKLPLTIPQLVANSPCKSRDGMLYTGRKIDTWFSIDPATGEKEQLLSFNEAKNTCPLKTQNAIFIGRTEYNIIMVDSKHKDRKWNVTFYDYSAERMEPDVVDNYDLLHFTTSSTGRVVTLDKRLGIVLWELDLKSPVIAMYILTEDGLLTVPFTSIAEGTLDSLLERLATKSTGIQLFKTLYVGQHRHGLYALPSLVDTDTTTISSNIEHLLLEGPLLTSQIDTDESEMPLPGNHVFIANIDLTNDYQNFKRKNIIMLDHYKIYAEYKAQNQPLQITGRSDPIIESSALNDTDTNLSIAVQTDMPNDTVQSESKQNWQRVISKTYSASKVWINQQEDKGLKLIMIILIGCVIVMFWYINTQIKGVQQLSQISRENSRTNYSNKDSLTIIPEDIGEGLVRVGKITFDTRQVLGKGCEGTFVYKGEFDGRAVAVKRLLPDCFMFADREVALLRESDAHANVVRYFCTEQDRMFRYIALELAEATLQDYVAGKYNREKISVKNILYQATSGVAHLHSLDIVHRDIKPHNVLLSVPGPRGEVRAMISDFGLCKKLQLGRVSFSRRSGVTGTDGWIAPEILGDNEGSATCAVDIFSLGCVFYYVLSDGKHPFGDPLRRQANILCDESNLISLQNMSANDRELALLLIKMMICSNPSDRPPALAIRNYPFFWSSLEILSFFQDVSDRVEKDQLDSPALIALETCGERVIENDWISYIDMEVASDLRKYRSYSGDSMRDLLRALRNKKHHYRELSPKAQESLGEIPDQFTEYWLSRFPYLLCHVWCAMQSFRDESNLKRYYHSQYTFSCGCEGQERVIRIARMKNALSTKRVNSNTNSTRYRGQRKKQEKKKQEESPTLYLIPSTN